MSISKKILTFIIIFSLMVFMLQGDVIISHAMEQNDFVSEENDVATGEYAKWKNTAITYPSQGQLVAAGNIPIEFQKLKDAIKYDIYVDDVLIKTFEVNEENVTTYKTEFYNVEVKKHSTYVIATFQDGSKVTTNIRFFYVSKKGMGIWQDDAEKIEELNLSWYYTWSPYELMGVSDEVEFVPMIWGDEASGAWDRVNEWKWLRDGNYKNYRHLLTFNEPDFAEQSNITPQRAVDLWPEMEKVREDGIRVSSPAVAIPTIYYGDTNNDYGVTGGWYGKYEELMAVAECHDDFTAVHIYADYPGEHILDAFEKIHEKTGKPLWITEWGIAQWSQVQNFDWTGGADEGNWQREMIVDFMEKTLPQLDELDYIERYAWFPFDGSNTEKYGNGAGGLFFDGENDPLKGQLTATGKAYQTLGNPEGWNPTVVTQDLPVKDYKYTFEWSQNHQKCNINFSFWKENEGNLTYPCEVKVVVKKAATCITKGITAYTASFVKGENTYTETKEVENLLPDVANHTGETELRNVKAASDEENGYTGDTYCKACGAMIEAGTVIEKTKQKSETPSEKPSEFPSEKPSETPSKEPAEAKYESVDSMEQTITLTDTDKSDVEGTSFANIRLKAVGKKNSINLTWKKVKDADGYILYGAQCGKKLKKLKTFNNASTTKYTHKKLKKEKYYKYMVVAYKNIDGEQYMITSSKSVHAVTDGGKYANPTKVSVKNVQMTVSKGKKKKINAACTIPEGKKLKVHIVKFRYESVNPEIATVTSKGVVKGRKKGNADIYVYAQNGTYKKVKITVK